MGRARDAILAAFVDLERQTGRDSFPLLEVCERVLAQTTEFQETTIRTYITSVMCADAPVHHGNHTDDLVRVGRGVYRRAVPSDDLALLRRVADQRLESSRRIPDRRHRGDTESEWHWEGNIQSTLVKHLAADDWAILTVANTASREHGVDVIASKPGRRLLVEVKGYPSRFYARGEKKGQVKKTSPSIQARVWFADLLMSGMLNADDEPDAEIALCMPDVPTYRSLAARVGGSLDALGFRRAWISEDGSIEWSGT